MAESGVSGTDSSSGGVGSTTSASSIGSASGWVLPDFLGVFGFATGSVPYMSADRRLSLSCARRPSTGHFTQALWKPHPASHLRLPVPRSIGDPVFRRRRQQPPGSLRQLLSEPSVPDPARICVALRGEKRGRTTGTSPSVCIRPQAHGEGNLIVYHSLIGFDPGGTQSLGQSPGTVCSTQMQERPEAAARDEHFVKRVHIA